MILLQRKFLNLMKVLPDLKFWKELLTKKQFKCSSSSMEPHILFDTLFEQVDAGNKRKERCALLNYH